MDLDTFVLENAVSMGTLHLDIYRTIVKRGIYRGSFMSTHVLLNLLNELRKKDKMRGLPSILSHFRNEFNTFNNTRAHMLDYLSYDNKITLKSHF